MDYSQPGDRSPPPPSGPWSRLVDWLNQAGGSLFEAFFYQGVHHILTGYDHLLFISALVLAATTFWDLIKVVTAFTIAHTITLSLAAFNLVSLPQRVVEPLIFASSSTHEPGKNGSAYYRIQGPNLVIEFSPQGVGGDPTMHIHTIYRDLTNDYGRALTIK